jgi:diadenosine tetraphosphatase ApaH/serine/threonine PP2A family protein phosphatase
LATLVGYGADPNAVVDCVRQLGTRAIVRGNHDKVASGLDNAEDFNPMAKAAARWTRESLTPQNLDYLRDLPAGPVVVDGAIEICHGSPLDEDLYVVADIDAARSIAVARAAICLFGHTHVALTARMDSQRRLEIEAPQGHPEFAVTIDAGSKYMINPARSDSPATAIRAPRTRLPTSIAWS